AVLGSDPVARRRPAEGPCMPILPLGPYRVVPLANGGEMPWYIVPFDREGICDAPQTRQDLMGRGGGQPFTAIYLFSHGWNNNWKDARERYQSFIEGYTNLRKDPPLPDEYRPLLVGVFWPSISLVTESEQPPRMLANGAPNESAIAEQRDRKAELAATVAP